MMTVSSDKHSAQLNHRLSQILAIIFQLVNFYKRSGLCQWIVAIFEGLDRQSSSSETPLGLTGSKLRGKVIRLCRNVRPMKKPSIDYFKLWRYF